MKRIRMTNAKLFIGKPDGTWEEIGGVTIGPFAYQTNPAPAAPMELPELRYFEATFVQRSPLILPPIGSDPSKN